MKKLEKLENNTKFLEIERKYKANTVDWDSFVKKCKKLKPYKELITSGPDTYYERGNFVIRWRCGEDSNELTIKSRFAKKSSLLRKEVDLKIPFNSPKTVINFIEGIGYKKIFRIYKYCNVFWFQDDIGKVSVVIYKVKSKKHPDRFFIEIEAEKGQSIKTSKKLIKKWEEKLGLKKSWRINKTLLEIYSDKKTKIE
jgi:adenylate cyclase class IV